MSDNYDLAALDDGECPAEGCGYDGTDTNDPLQNVWRHAKNVKDDNHLKLTEETSLSEWRLDVGDQEEDVDDDPDGADPDGETEDVEQDSEGTDEEGDEMVNAEEYARQHSDDDEEEQPEETEMEPVDADDSGTTFADVGGSWMLYAGAALVALLVLVYVLRSRESSESAPTAPSTEVETTSTSEQSSEVDVDVDDTGGAFVDDAPEAE